MSIELKRRLHASKVRLRKAELALSRARRDRDDYLMHHPHVAEMSYEQRSRAGIAAVALGAVRDARSAHDVALHDLTVALRSMSTNDVRELRAAWEAEHRERTGAAPAECNQETCPYGEEESNGSE